MHVSVSVHCQCRVQDDRFRTTAGQSKLAGTMVELFEQVRSRFTVDDYRHYLFTPRELTAWVMGLLRYDVAAESRIHKTKSARTFQQDCK